MSTSAQIGANRANSQHSSGPKSEEGKAASSKNRLGHGLTGRFIVLKWESQDDYTLLENELIAEHRPAAQTEKMLVRRMAESYWLRGRAVFMQDALLSGETQDEFKNLALYIRYQVTHDRAFYKALGELQNLRAQKEKDAIGFDSQERQKAGETRKQLDEERKRELHRCRIAILESKLQGEQTKKAGRESRILSPTAAENSFAPLLTAA